MPQFSASTIPSVVGLFVDKFIDPAGQLSFITVTSGGTGYDANNPPTIQLSGGGGSGAIIDPVIQGGRIVGLRYRHISGLGSQRGSGYNTTAPIIQFVGGVGSGAAATVQLSKDTTILGKTANEDAFLQFCVNHNINYITLYELSNMNWGSATSTNLSAPGTNLLANFIAKARTSGITEVGATRSGSNSTVNQIINYNNQRSTSTERFDYFTVENEWWNGDVTFANYLSNLIYAHNTCTGATYPMKVEIYIGWPDPGEMEQLIRYYDRLLIHDYASSKKPDYNYTKNRLIDTANACVTYNKTIDVMPIFSAESERSPWNAQYEFMGTYYTANTIYDAYYAWAVPYVSTTRGSYNFESNVNVRERLNPTGHIIFDWTLLRASNPPLPTGGTSCVASISALGPTTVPSGGTVVLRATNGTDYLWSPSGETTQQITATTSGNYSCRVINGSCTAYTNTINVIVTNNPFEIDIIPDGPVFFSSGGSVSLSATTVVTGATEPYTYQWYSATTSGGTYVPFSIVNPQVISYTGYYYVGVSGSTTLFSGNSEVIFIDANYNLNNGGATEEPTELVLNHYIEYTDQDTVFPWLHYAIISIDINQYDYYVFVKMKSRNGRKTGVRVSTDGGFNYTSITNVERSDNFYWYRIGVRFYGNQIELANQRSVISLQATNNAAMITSFAFSENPNFIPGPYPA